MSQQLEIPTNLPPCENFVGGQFVPGSGLALSVTSPYTGEHLTEVSLSSEEDVAGAVRVAQSAFPEWAARPLRERVAPLRRFGELLRAEADALAQTVALESGKTPAEARAGIERGLEVVDFAASQPNADTGAALEVSRGVSCEYRRVPLGVVAGVTPFNFPAMVPLWMVPLALTVGNAFILKPSEKVPLSASALARLTTQAGYPPGVFSVVHGGGETVRALAEDARVRALGFVGSTPVAAQVYALCGSRGKRALCLGGAKNLMIAAPDADVELTAKAVVDSFTGCAGQRCMAGSVLAIVRRPGSEGFRQRLLAAIVERASALELGVSMGALIDNAARERLLCAIETAEQAGVRVLLDGRRSAVPADYAAGSWLGPTVLGGVLPEMPCAREELFGPVLSVMELPSLEAALEFEQESRYGNAVSVFTGSGAVARAVRERASSGMIGVNVGVPVPREPFSFGGAKASKFGHGDITGPSAWSFWSDLKKVTTKWEAQPDQTWMS